MRIRKVRVVKASKPTYWYARRIGEIFEVDIDKPENGDYRDLNCLNCFLKINDIEIVNGKIKVILV